MCGCTETFEALSRVVGLPGVESMDVVCDGLVDVRVVRS
jgi:hypothetical protein